MKKKIFISFIICIITMIFVCLILNEDFASTLNYKLNSDSKMIYRIEPNTLANEFIAKVANEIKTNEVDIVKLYQTGENGFEEVTDGIVKTKMRVAKNPTISNDVEGNSTIHADNPIYKTVVIGDLNMDGIYNQIDLSALIRHHVGYSKDIITDQVILKAADVNDDEKIDIIDITASINYILYDVLPSNTNRKDYNMELSETTGTTTCPNTKTFTITNPTGGKITVSSSNEEIATASINENTITVTPIKSGTAIITVTSEETAEYKSGTATYEITVNKGTGYIALSNNSGTVRVGQTITVNVTSIHGNSIRAYYEDASIVSVSVNARNKTVSITGVGVGETTVTVKAPEDDSYTEASAVYTITVTE